LAISNGDENEPDEPAEPQRQSDLGIASSLTPANYQQQALEPTLKPARNWQGYSSADTLTFFTITRDKRVCVFCM